MLVDPTVDSEHLTRADIDGLWPLQSTPVDSVLCNALTDLIFADLECLAFIVAKTGLDAGFLVRPVHAIDLVVAPKVLFDAFTVGALSFATLAILDDAVLVDGRLIARVRAVDLPVAHQFTIDAVSVATLEGAVVAAYALDTFAIDALFTKPTVFGGLAFGHIDAAVFGTTLLACVTLAAEVAAAVVSAFGIPAVGDTDVVALAVRITDLVFIAIAA